MKRIGVDARAWRSETGGLGRYNRNLISQLVKLDRDNHYTIIIRPTDEAEFALEAPNVQKLVVPIPYHGVAEQTKLLKVLNQQRFDLVHFTYFSHPLLYRRPFVVTIHDLILHIFPTGRQTRSLTRRWAYHLVMNDTKRAERVIAPSQATKSDLVTMLRCPETQIAVVPNGNDAMFRPHRQKEVLAVKERFGLPDRFVIFVSRWDKYKGLIALLEAFEIVGKRFPGIALVVCGEPTEQSPEVAALVAAKQREGQNIITPGLVTDEDLSALYSAASVYVNPSRYEGFGLPILEAFASGVPVVASNVSSLPEVVGDAGLLIDPHAPREIAEKVTTVLSDEKLAEVLRRRGLERVPQFSWKKAAEQTLDVYRKALERGA